MRKKIKRMKLNFKLIFLGIFFFLLLMFFYYLRKSVPLLFVIKNIEINERMEERLKENIEGKSLLTINLQKIRQKILENHSEYKDVFILKKFPSTLKIEIVKRIPFAQWKGERFFLLDEGGRIISDAQDIPFFNFIPIEINDYKKSLRKGKKIADERLYYAFALIKEMKKRDFFKKFPLTLVNPTKLNSFYFIMKRIKVIVGKDNLSKKIDLLENLLKKEEIRENISKIKYIDLRYKKVYFGFKR